MNGAKGDFTPPSYSHWYLVRSVEIEGAKGSYYNFAVTQERPLNNKEAELLKKHKSFLRFVKRRDAARTTQSRAERTSNRGPVYRLVNKNC